ncbi:MAG TPA: glycosyltransferase [Polyangia bacterium]
MVASDDDLEPLISCILPTYNRRAFLPHALHYFLRQDYRNKELLIVDDGPDAVGDLVPADPRIRYLRLPQKITLGAKLNLCCAETRGPIIAQWDDDDWYGPDRLTRQLQALRGANADVCGVSDLLYYDLRRATAHRYVYPKQERPWLLGASLFFRRALWQQRKFVEVDVGMDALFVWATAPEKVCSVPPPRFAVHLIHRDNVSPKGTQGAWWSDHPVDDVAAVLGDDWPTYAPGSAPLAAPRPRPPAGASATPPPAPAPQARLEIVAADGPPRVAPPRHVYACLVHEERDCVIDLCANLRAADPESTILLYNGGHDAALLAPDPAFDRLGAVVHPDPRPMRWGSLHDFALDCMRFAGAAHPFDALTIVDSDQLALRPGWTAAVRACLARDAKVGLLGNNAARLRRGTDHAAAGAAWREVDLWRPFLQRFPDGENKFVHWSFWPGTVFSGDAARALVDLCDHDQELREILRQTRLWVTEEIVFPTLTALLGFRVARSPDSYRFLRYRFPYARGDVDKALADAGAYWIHPIPRRRDDPLRAAIRGRRTVVPGAAVAASPAAAAPVPEQLRQPILAAMRRVRGWLADAEAELLITVTGRALAACPDARALVEIGSFRGKATTVLASVVRAMRPQARVWAVDPHDGVVGDLERGVAHEGPTLASFRRNIARAGLDAFVETVQARTPDVAWSEPICLLLVDGLHDYASVARDFHHFEAFLADPALVAFHDYADYFPGVKTFVDELLGSGRYRLVEQVASLIVLRKGQPAVADAQPAPPASNAARSFA